MCAGCKSGQFTDNNGAMGDDGIAVKNNPKYDGVGNTAEKFDGLKAEKNDSAKVAENTGRQ
jgi:hypothetical protein